MSRDILLYETGNGGSVRVIDDDIAMVESLFQQCYLALFGGNVEASTTGKELPNQIRNDWWGNSLIFGSQPAKQFNSKTERVLDTVTLNTSGRIQIRNAVIDDLKYLRNVSKYDVEVVLLSHSRVRIEIVLMRVGDSESKKFDFIWDNAARETIIEETI